MRRGNYEILQEDLVYKANSEIPFDNLRNSSVLVTGTTGLIGVPLVRELLRANRVRNLNLQVFALIRRKKAETIYGNLLKKKELSLILGDMTKKYLCRKE